MAARSEWRTEKKAQNSYEYFYDTVHIHNFFSRLWDLKSQFFLSCALGRMFRSGLSRTSTQPCCAKMLYAVGEKPREKEEKPTIGSRLNASWIFLCSAQQNLSQKQREEEEKKRLFLPQPTSCFASFMERFYDHHHCSTNLQRSISSCMYFYEAKERTPGEKTDRR